MSVFPLEDDRYRKECELFDHESSLGEYDIGEISAMGATLTFGRVTGQKKSLVCVVNEQG